MFPPEAGQSEVYEGTAKPHIPALLEGIDVTVFAYGATGEIFYQITGTHGQFKFCLD